MSCMFSYLGSLILLCFTVMTFCLYTCTQPCSSVINEISVFMMMMMMMMMICVFFSHIVKFIFLYLFVFFCLPLYGEMKICI